MRQKIKTERERRGVVEETVDENEENKDERTIEHFYLKTENEKPRTGCTPLTESIQLWGELGETDGDDMQQRPRLRAS